MMPNDFELRLLVNADVEIESEYDIYQRQDNIVVPDISKQE